jgi:L-ascorbate metabolism protein UlaG (beta-lactamase superfamily)
VQGVIANLTWRHCSNWAKTRPITLRLADRLGRGRGRLRVLDRIHPPARCRLKPDLSDWETHDLAAVWIGHATVLLRVGGMTVLTDPVLFNRVGVGLGLATGGPRRLVAPALSLRELPAIDLLLISHAHFDHLDRPTLARLPKHTPVVTAHQTSDLIRDLGFRRVDELRWGESVTIDTLTVTAHKVAHWGARTFYDQHRGFNAYLIESAPDARRVLYGGDSAYHDGLKELPHISTRGVDLAILGIGAYDPYVQAHATPEQALAMADHCRAERILPMHHSTFRLSHEPTHEPLERLLTAAGRDTDRLVASEPGRTWTSN